MLKSCRFTLPCLLLALWACGKDAVPPAQEQCRVIEVDGDPAARINVSRVSFRLFPTSSSDMTFLTGQPAAQRRYDTAVPTSLTVCKGASDTPLSMRIFGTDSGNFLMAASSAVLVDPNDSSPITVMLSANAIIAGDLVEDPGEPEIVPSSQGLPIEQLISEMKTPIASPGYDPVQPIGFGDGVRASVTQGVNRSDAMQTWADDPPPETLWRGQRPGLIVLFGAGHTDNGTWRVEVANVDFQVYSASQDRWIRPSGYPTDPSQMFAQGNGGATTGVARNDGTLPLSSVYTMPKTAALGGTHAPVLGGAARPGYEDPGDGTDVISVFISGQVRLVPSGVGAFDPTGAVLFLQVTQEILPDLTQDDGNNNISVGQRLTSDVATHTFTLFRDSGDAIDFGTPKNPARLDEVPTEAWLRTHPPIGVIP